MKLLAVISPRYTVVPATFSHIREMGIAMRSEDAAEAAGLGGEPKSLLWRSYRNSLYAHAATVDGKLAAVWGLSGSPLGEVGRPWLITAPAMDEASPFFCARLGRGQAQAMLDLHPRLENYVAADYGRAIRFLKIMGFTVESAQPYPGTGAPFCKFWMEVS